MRIETLATCHNRRDTTLQAVADLHAQWLPKHVEIGHTIVDDGSSDGTKEAIQKAYPEVEIVQGDGQLFWAGGMRYGWGAVVKHKSFDYLLVYNDDVRLRQDALARLLEVGQAYVSDGGSLTHAVVGAFLDDEGSTSYGGVVRTSRWHPLRFNRVDPPAGAYTLVDSMNMNACLISRTALRGSGFLSDYFVHTGADYEYGLKLRADGGAVVMAPVCVGTCKRNTVKGTSGEKGISIRERYKRLMGVKEQPPMQRMEYYKRYGGKFWPFWFVLPYVGALFRKR